MKSPTKILLALFLAASVAACGTNADLRAKSMTDAQAAVKQISDKREDTKVALARENTATRKATLDVCAAKTGVDMAICMLGAALIDKGGSSQVAAAEPLPQLPVMAVEKSPLREFGEFAISAVAAVSPIAGAVVQAYAQIKGQELQVELGKTQAVYNFEAGKARDGSTVAIVTALAPKGPSTSITVFGDGVIGSGGITKTNIGGDGVTGGGAINRVGGDGTSGGGISTKKNCTGATQAGTVPPATVTTGGTLLAPITTTTPQTPSPSGPVAINC